jgi:RimJ/RimL family protein N-acetyltransferase
LDWPQAPHTTAGRSAGLAAGFGSAPVRFVRAAGPVACVPMTAATYADADALLRSFLSGDEHYLASSTVYGEAAARRCYVRSIFLAHPAIGFVWLAFADDGGRSLAVGACVVCHAISTSRGTLVAKLDDVTIRDGWQGRGVGTAMLRALVGHLGARGITRIDSGCHRDNTGAWRFYERLGFKPLDEERLALLLA